MIVITVIFIKGFRVGDAYTIVKGWYLTNISQTIVRMKI